MKICTRQYLAAVCHTTLRYTALLFTAGTLGCSTASVHLLHSFLVRDHSPTLDSIAEAYVRVALELGERDPDSLDFATVSAALREAVHQSYPSYDVIDRETTQLLSQLHSLPPQGEQQSRTQFLIQQLQATQARIAMLRGRTFNFDREALILFKTERIPDRRQQERAAVRAQIAALLPSSRRSASQAYAVYTAQFLIPPDRLPAVMSAALAACRTQTLAHLALPARESVSLTFVRNKPWSAFSRFQGEARSTIEINVGFPITIDQALELACHEGYPGHHVFNTLREIALAHDQHLPEAQVQLTFSPQSYISESAAAYAPRLVFSDQERARVERDILFPLAGLPPTKAERYVTISSLVRQLDTAEPAIAQRYLDGELEFVRAAHSLQAEMLMEHGEATLLYLNQYRSYMLAYTNGPARIAAHLQQSPGLMPISPQHRDLAWKRYSQLTEKELINLPDPS